MIRLLVILTLGVLPSCARKNPPEPPANAIRSDAPVLIAPDVVTDPIRASVD